MRALLRHLDFRPHGPHLLTASAEFWLMSARVLVFAMAASEALAWAYLGYLFGDGLLRWVAAAFTGVVIFLVVWMIDVSLITMDRAWPEHAARILGLPQTRNRRARDLFTFGVRVALLVGSLTITAPYLAQLVFHRDIAQANATLAATRIDSARSALVARQDAVLAAKQREIAERREAFEREIAGVGTSGRFGTGPTAAAIQRNIASLEAERDSLARTAARERREFDLLARDAEANRGALAARYNVLLPEQTILGSYAVLEELRKRPENRQTELAIKAFLAFIFAGLLLLKLFEPYTVRLYFSEVLQQEFTRYRAGSFDDALPDPERSTRTPSPMTPQRLYEFLTDVWRPSRHIETQEAQGRAQLGVARDALATMQRMRDNALEEMNLRKEEVVRLQAAVTAAERASTQMASAMKVVENDLQNFEARRRELEERRGALDDQGFHELRTSLGRRVTEASAALRGLHERAPEIRTEEARAREELAEAQGRLRRSAAAVDAAEAKLDELRRLMAESTSARARSALRAS